MSPDSGPLATTVDTKSRLGLDLGSFFWEVEIQKTLISFNVNFKMGIHKKLGEGRKNLSLKIRDQVERSGDSKERESWREELF